MSTSGGGVGTLLGAGGKGLQGSILNLFPERFSLALWRNVPVPHPLSYQVEKKKNIQRNNNKNHQVQDWATVFPENKWTLIGILYVKPWGRDL